MKGNSNWRVVTPSVCESLQTETLPRSEFPGPYNNAPRVRSASFCMSRRTFRRCSASENRCGPKGWSTRVVRQVIDRDLLKEYRGDHSGATPARDAQVC